MTKQTDAEAAIRSAAATLAEAVAKGRAEGLTVSWPNRPEGLAAIAISSTGKAKIDVTVHASGGIAPATAAKATAAAQKTVDRVIDKAVDKTA